MRTERNGKGENLFKWNYFDQPMKVKGLIIGFFIAAMLSGCSAELKLAKSFTQQAKQTKVAVYFPEEATVTLVQDEEGSYTKVLDSLNQNAFLDLMYEAYADGLRAYGMEVYIPENQNNVTVDSLHWMVLVSKVEIQGKFTDYVDQVFDYVDVYEFPFSLNTVNVASWFDINNGDWLPTLYYEHNLMDGFSSKVTRRKDTGTQYHYDIRTLVNDDLYHYAVYLGKQYAAYTYDAMMNRYIATELKKPNDMLRFKLGYDPKRDEYYFMEEEEGFMEVQ